MDAVLLDLNLPDSWGVETVRRLRNHDAAVPLVVFTSAGDEKTAAAAVASGAQDYFVKDELGASLLPARLATRSSGGDSRRAFEGLYARTGRPSIAPEKLLRALLLQVLYTVRSERQLMEQLDYNLLFRWFVGLNADDPVWDATVFTKNRDRLLAGDVAQAFFEAVLGQAKAKRLLSDEHFTVDGTLIEAWASHKGLVWREDPERRDSDDDDPGNPTVNFRGEQSNETHVSATDPEARLVRRKGEASRLAFLGHVLMENRTVEAVCTEADGYAEREAALELWGDRRGTLGADRGYDTEALVGALRLRDVTPHVAQNTTGRASAIDGRTTRHAGYAES